MWGGTSLVDHIISHSRYSRLPRKRPVGHKMKMRRKMRDKTSQSNDPEISKLIQRSDELVRQSNEITKNALTNADLRTLDKKNKEILRNCDRLLGLLQHLD